ncbi:MAG TPA: Hpt domain-containing protein [Candidatus Obscuribacterales bacterium]
MITNPGYEDVEMPVDNQPLFDYASLEEDLDAECAAELAKSFLEDATQVVERLAQAVSSKDKEAVRANAHKLRGACRSINALPVERESSALEDAAVSGDWTRIESCFSSVRPLYETLVKEIQNYLNKG